MGVSLLEPGHSAALQMEQLMLLHRSTSQKAIIQDAVEGVRSAHRSVAHTDVRPPLSLY